MPDGTVERRLVCGTNAAACAYPADVAACTAAGMDLFLAKPATLDQLEDILGRAIRRD